MEACAAEMKKLPDDALALAVLARLNGDDPCTFVTNFSAVGMKDARSFAHIWHKGNQEWCSNYELVSVSIENDIETVRWLKLSGDHGCR